MTLRTTVAIVVVLAVISAAVAATLVLARPGATESDVVAQVAPPPNEPESLAAATGGGTAEGIKVHGDWVIEVRDPDGSLVQRREFQNAISTTGAERLAQVLARESRFNGWHIVLTGSDAFVTSPCLLSNGNIFQCRITETSTESNYFPNLSVTRNGGQLILSGTATAQRDGDIADVDTSVGLCDYTNTSSCSSPLNFTFQSITPISVSTGQSILATVTISFS